MQPVRHVRRSVPRTLRGRKVEGGRGYFRILTDQQTDKQPATRLHHGGLDWTDSVISHSGRRQHTHPHMLGVTASNNNTTHNTHQLSPCVSPHNTNTLSTTSTAERNRIHFGFHVEIRRVTTGSLRQSGRSTHALTTWVAYCDLPTIDNTSSRLVA